MEDFILEDSWRIALAQAMAMAMAMAAGVRQAPSCGPRRDRMVSGRRRHRVNSVAAAALHSETLRRDGCGSTAVIYPFGGCVTSWRPRGGADRLYVRPDAKFDGSKPISGGIPHCWPQFGPSDSMQQVRDDVQIS